MRSVWLALLALPLATAGGAVPPSGEERERLEAGDVIIESLEPAGGSGVALRGTAMVPAPPAQVWAVVRDCGEFERFMPRIRDSRRLEREDGTVCRMTVDMPFPFDDVFSEVRSVEETLPGGGFRRRWSLLAGDLERSQGSWTVHPWDEAGERALLVYENDAKPKSVLPDFILRAAQRRTVPDALRAVRQRVAERQPEPHPAPP